MMGKGSMRLGELRAEVARFAKKMVASGLVRAAQGNLSARDPESGLICITPSGMDYDLVTAKDIVVIDEQGEVIEGAHRPSVETPLHTLLLRRRSDIHCVIHTHSLYATAFGVVYEPLPMVLAESALCLGGTIPIAPYQMSGTPEFAELIAETMGDANAIIWGNHGAMVVGPSLNAAFSAAHALEDGAKVYVLARQLGTPVPLPPDEVTKLHTFWREHYAK
ncbi:MAG TPA: class II aldolase/adducin family protein [Ktedonobacterales bacterium]|jgi:L-fuculose-phosphate aldolase